MTDREKWAIFLVFLEVHGALGSYKYYRKVAKTARWAPLSVRKSCLHGYVDRAFPWDGTRQGWEYWNEINQKWVELCDAGVLD